LATAEKTITDWVFTNLTGRFYFGDHHYTDDSGRRCMSKVLAFEVASEASYFGLFLDQVNTRSNMVW
jgi:hypothetical protein